MDTDYRDQNIVEFSHGGFCCGMTHLYNFFQAPASQLGARPEWSPSKWVEEIKNNPPYYGRINKDIRPIETALERLEGMIRAIEEGVTVPDDKKMYDGEPYYPNGRLIRAGRPSGIIEAVLIGSQKSTWDKEFLRLGFKLVNENKNSNSSNIVYVYHRNSGTVPTITEMRDKAKPKAA